MYVHRPLLPGSLAHPDLYSIHWCLRENSIWVEGPLGNHRPPSKSVALKSPGSLVGSTGSKVNGNPKVGKGPVKVVLGQIPVSEGQPDEFRQWEHLLKVAFGWKIERVDRG
ncbi:hypothetical protein TNIN_2981 [Trichonephila inaurata madagascariensis]|uniref:Uncharacterized protein n=1 Tax=Trichonephila inaurata madagascariensis TaxID=2747483 RepID=A0A8X6YQM1_9ARAC|nr:hypothetical protein TNIN_2981 [Trichonephila inaurata madagascariensis]